MPLVGKYTDLKDTYMSVTKALEDSAFRLHRKAFFPRPISNANLTNTNTIDLKFRLKFVQLASRPNDTPPRQSRSRTCYGDLGRIPLHRRETSKTYEWLQDLLKEAGYKETRVFTQ